MVEEGLRTAEQTLHFHQSHGRQKVFTGESVCALEGRQAHHQFPGTQEKRQVGQGDVSGPYIWSTPCLVGYHHS